jgi:hypothetical protein
VSPNRPRLQLTCSCNPSQESLLHLSEHMQCNLQLPTVYAEKCKVVSEESWMLHRVAHCKIALRTRVELQVFLPSAGIIQGSTFYRIISTQPHNFQTA